MLTKIAAACVIATLLAVPAEAQGRSRQDLWQLHYAVEGGADHNVPEDLIANPHEQCEGKYLKLSAQPDGTCTVLNSRNRYSKRYTVD